MSSNPESSLQSGTKIRVLLIEDSPSDKLMIEELFSEYENTDFQIDSVETLSDAIKAIEGGEYHAILLDLGLPDSQGADTFSKIHQQAQNTPILVLSGLEEGKEPEVVQSEAEGFISKKDSSSTILRSAVRYAVAGTRRREKKAEKENKDRQEKEFKTMNELSAQDPTPVTSRLYASGPLRENAPGEFKLAVCEYRELLDLALESQAFKSDSNYKDRLLELAQKIGFLRGSPKDVVDIHATAVKKLIEFTPQLKAQAYLEEGRIMVLELMGHLTSYYRLYYRDGSNRESFR